MDLAEKLLKIPERENAGARSSNRFSFQQVWAFDYMLKIIDADSDFFLFMEFHDDIIVLSKTEQEEYIEFFQIKTDDKDSRYITPSFITKGGNKFPEKMSIIQKIIDEFVKFEKETRKIHLVSNKNFNFGELVDKTETKNKRSFVFEDVNQTSIKQIKKDMCKACNKVNICKEECLSIIYFDVSDLDLESYEDTVMGRMIKKLDDMKILSTTERTHSIYNTILGEIRRINNTEKMAGNVSELLTRKAISKKDFLNWLDKLKVEMPDDLWTQVNIGLLNDGFTTLEIRKIHKGWKRYQIDRINIDALGLQSLETMVQNIIEQGEFDNCKDWVEYIYNKISTEPNAKIYDKYYLYALIISRLTVSTIIRRYFGRAWQKVCVG